VHAVVYTTNPAIRREYRLGTPSGLQLFAHYGPEGSGFGYASFRLQRTIGYDYQDIGYGHRLRIYKGPWRCIFDGQIARITERITEDGRGEIEVWATGWSHVAQADVYNYIYSDTRYRQWKSSETPDGNFQPQKFAYDLNNRIYLKPRRGAEDNYTQDGYYTYVRYTFPFGEPARRLTATYALSLPLVGDAGDFPCKAQIYAGETLLWESATDGDAGALDLSAAGASYFEVRLVYTDNLYEVSAVDDTVYLLLEDVRVYSVDGNAFNTATIGADIVNLLAASYHGISNDVRRVADTGFSLTQAAFDTDGTPADILTWLCRFGTSAGGPAAWGMDFNDRRLLFIEAQDTTTVRYVVKAGDATQLERAGDWGESAQVVYGVYTDAAGEVQRTSDLQAASIIEQLGGYYRRRAVQLDNVTQLSTAALALATHLNENKKPRISGTYKVKQVRTPAGQRVPFDEIVPGGLVRVDKFRAIEAEAESSDYRNLTTTFMCVGVRVDYEDGSAELIPQSEGDAFQRQMRIIAGLTAEQ